jgi:hypothetical protein
MSGAILEAGALRVCPGDLPAEDRGVELSSPSDVIGGDVQVGKATTPRQAGGDRTGSSFAYDTSLISAVVFVKRTGMADGEACGISDAR